MSYEMQFNAMSHTMKCDCCKSGSEGCLWICLGYVHSASLSDSIYMSGEVDSV